jgi:hypothetical protein
MKMGFLESYVAQPAQDADGDGVADENDDDDDGDALADLQEVTGSAFQPLTATDPLVADTDGDRVTDGTEAVAGTDPGRSQSHLAITAIQRAGAQSLVSWRSRAGYFYDLYGATDVSGLGGDQVLVATVQAGSGTGIWQEAYSMAADTAAVRRSFYRVQVWPP